MVSSYHDILINPSYDPLHAVTLFTLDDARRAQEVIRDLDEYSETPIESLSTDCAEYKVASAHIKNEGQRFATGSFKVLGAYYGAFFAIAGEAGGGGVGSLRTGGAIRCSQVDEEQAHLSCATDGNFGCGVAWSARRLGRRAHIYVSSAIAASRVELLKSLGADVVRIEGTYEEALEKVASESSASGWILVSDTAFGSYEEIPKKVMEGYTLLLEEVQQIAQFRSPPTHVFLQVGVGGFAAAVIAYGQLVWGGGVRYILVESRSAECAHISLKRGIRTRVKTLPRTVCSGLACGELSTTAWPIIKQGAFASIVLEDAEVIAGKKRLKEVYGIELGESGCAGYAAFTRCATENAIRLSLGLDRESRILLFGTEKST